MRAYKYLIILIVLLIGCKSNYQKPNMTRISDSTFLVGVDTVQEIKEILGPETYKYIIINGDTIFTGVSGTINVQVQ